MTSRFAAQLFPPVRRPQPFEVGDRVVFAHLPNGLQYRVIAVGRYPLALGFAPFIEVDALLGRFSPETFIRAPL